jgi:cytochrome P450
MLFCDNRPTGARFGIDPHGGGAVALPGATDINYNPVDYEIDANVHAVWRRMRDEAPLYRNDEYDFWALSRYDDVLPAMLDTQSFSSASGTTIEMLSAELPAIRMMIFMEEVDYDRAEMVHTTTVRGYAKVPVRV